MRNAGADNADNYNYDCSEEKSISDPLVCGSDLSDTVSGMKSSLKDILKVLAERNACFRFLGLNLRCRLSCGCYRCCFRSSGSFGCCRSGLSYRCCRSFRCRCCCCRNRFSGCC